MTLAETQQNMKKWGVYLAIAIVVFYGGRFTLRLGYSTYLWFFPPEQAKPIALPRTPKMSTLTPLRTPLNYKTNATDIDNLGTKKVSKKCTKTNLQL